jgi:conjugative transposon TraN protein
MYKHLLVFIAFTILTAFHAFCQSAGAPLPTSTLVPHFLIAVNVNTTTVLVFPAAVRPVDRGDKDVLAQKQTGVENVLKLKAARRNFPMTNLHVFTADGRIYAFDVAYTDSLASTHDLSRLVPDNASARSITPILLTREPINVDQMHWLVDALGKIPAIRHAPVSRHDRMKFKLERIAFSGPLLFFSFQMTNRSNLDYHIDFVRLYVRDRQKAKRTSVQETELAPAYADSLLTVPGKTTARYVIAIPAFTLTDGKQFLVEAYEKNGGRTMTLHIPNRLLFKASKL